MLGRWHDWRKTLSGCSVSTLTCHLWPFVLTLSNDMVFLANYRCYDLKECSLNRTTRQTGPFVCVCLYVSNAFAFHRSNTEQLCSFRFPRPLLTTVGPETFSHPLFNLLVILDITAGASHLHRLPVFVLLSCREFLWPCLLDFCTTHCFLLVCFFFFCVVCTSTQITSSWTKTTCLLF